MGKVKKEKQSADESQDVSTVSVKEEDTYDDKLKNCSVIAKPMAPKKLSKKCLKLIKKGLFEKIEIFDDISSISLILLRFFPEKNEIITNSCIFRNILASKQKTFLRNGLKDVQSRLKKGETG